MVKKYFLRKITKRAKIMDIFNFFQFTKQKSITIIVKYLRAFSL